MKIDIQATAETIKQLRPGTLAAHCGATKELVSKILTGKYPRMNGPKAVAVISRLRELGVLVEVYDDVHDSKVSGLSH